MDAIIRGVLLLRMVPVMADAVATSSRFRQEPITLSPVRSSLRKARALNQTVYWQGQKQGGVCCAEEMAEEIITTKETLPPIHSPTSYSPWPHFPSAITLPDIRLLLPRSISAIRTLEQAWGSRRKQWWCPEDSHAWAAHCPQHGGIPGLSPPHSERVLRQTLTDSSLSQATVCLRFHVISAAQSSKLKLAYRCEPATKKPSLGWHSCKSATVASKLLKGTIWKFFLL